MNDDYKMLVAAQKARNEISQFKDKLSKLYATIPYQNRIYGKFTNSEAIPLDIVSEDEYVRKSLGDVQGDFYFYKKYHPIDTVLSKEEKQLFEKLTDSRPAKLIRNANITWLIMAILFFLFSIFMFSFSFATFAYVGYAAIAVAIIFLIQPIRTNIKKSRRKNIENKAIERLRARMEEESADNLKKAKGRYPYYVNCVKEFNQHIEENIDSVNEIIANQDKSLAQFSNADIDTMIMILEQNRANNINDAYAVLLKEQKEAAEIQRQKDAEVEQLIHQIIEKLAQQQAQQEYSEQMLLETMEHNRRMEEYEKESIRMQKEAEQNAKRMADKAEREARQKEWSRQMAFNNAQNEYNRAARFYESYSKQGLTEDALRSKREMEQWAAEMLRYK